MHENLCWNDTKDLICARPTRPLTFSGPVQYFMKILMVNIYFRNILFLLVNLQLVLVIDRFPKL